MFTTIIMHYKNGREAHEGEPVIAQSYGKTYAGNIHSIVAGVSSCNAQIAYPVFGGMSHTCVTVGDCYHAEDAFAAIAGQEAAKWPNGSPVAIAPACSAELPKTP